MRLDTRDAMSGLDVGNDQILEQRRLAGAGLSKNCEMAATVVNRQANQIPLRRNCVRAKLTLSGRWLPAKISFGGGNSLLSTRASLGTRTVLLGGWNSVATSSQDNRNLGPGTRERWGFPSSKAPVLGELKCPRLPASCCSRSIVCSRCATGAVSETRSSASNSCRPNLSAADWRSD